MRRRYALPIVAAVWAVTGVERGPARMLADADLDPAALLAPPPAAGSAQARAELATLHRMEAARTPAMVAAARWDTDHKSASIYAGAMGSRFDLARLPATAAMIATVRMADKDAVARGKAFFRRPRPWIADPAIATCDRGDEPLSSYPSGHTTMAYATGAALADAAPDRAGAIMARAGAYGQGRIICEQHFPSDVAAGRILGLAVVDRLMRKPAFRRMMALARAELFRAGLTQVPDAERFGKSALGRVAGSAVIARSFP